jgi:hypothetical protein
MDRAFGLPSRTFVVAAVLHGVLLGGVPSALALSECIYDPNLFDAPMGNETVPTNTRVWLWSDPDQAFRVEVEDGTPIALFVSLIAARAVRGEQFVVLTPVVELEPETDYFVFEDGEDARAGAVLTFTTGEAADHEAPGLPGVLGQSANSGFAELNLSSTGLFEVVRFVGDDDLDVANVDGEVRAIDHYGRLQLGRPDCWRGWDDAGYETQEIQLGTFDLAGNFSGWGEPVLLEADPACGRCSNLGAASGGGSWLLLLLLSRRRRLA